MNPNSLFSLIPQVELSVVTSLILIFLFKRYSKLHFDNFLLPAGMMIVLLVAFLVPMNIFGAPWLLPLIGYIRAATGDLSVTSFGLILFGLSLNIRSLKPKIISPILIAIISIIFYPMSLGLTMLDPYSLGFGSLTFVSITFILSGLFLLYKYYLESFIIALAIIAWGVGWHESTNLWDYLLDPFLAIWSIIVSTSLISSKIKRAFNSLL